MKTIFTLALAVAALTALPGCGKEKETASVAQPTLVAAEVKAVPEAKPAATDVPVYKTVCLDVQGRDGKPVMDPKTGKPKQNCTKVRVRQKFEGTPIEDAKKK